MGKGDGCERLTSAGSRGSKRNKALEHHGAERRTPLSERNDMKPLSERSDMKPAKGVRPISGLGLLPPAVVAGDCWSARADWEPRPPQSQRDRGVRPHSARRRLIDGSSAFASAYAPAHAGWALNLPR